jgi:hypothetical protein
LGISESDLKNENNAESITFSQAYEQAVSNRAQIFDDTTEKALRDDFALICNALVKEYYKEAYDAAQFRDRPIIMLPRILWKKLLEPNLLKAYYHRKDEDNPVSPELFDFLNKYSHNGSRSN